jgi:alcohol dehydrogenase
VIVGNGDVGAQLRDAGGADVVLSTTVDPGDIAAVMQGLRVRGTLVLTGMTANPLSIMPAVFAFAQQRVIGTRREQGELLDLAARRGTRPLTEVYPLSRVNEVHDRLRNQQVRLRAVLTPG